jgi:hypothetical protein
VTVQVKAGSAFLEREFAGDQLYWSEFITAHGEMDTKLTRRLQNRGCPPSSGRKRQCGSEVRFGEIGSSR